MKEGLAYISKRTNQVRYTSGASKEDANVTGITSNNPDEQWLQQVSIYYAKEEIKRGDPVSVTTLSNEGLEEDPNPYIVKTDSSIHTKCIGIALEYARAGTAVHVQPFGKVIYDESKPEDKEHKFSKDVPGLYNTLIGKVVYIGQEAGTFTVDFDQAYANGRNIIQVGVITDAPANGSQHEYAIELQPEADGRGPLDSTQFELKIGENVHFNANEIKVFALAGESNGGPFRATIIGNPPNGFIMFEPADGSAPTFYGNSNTSPSAADLARIGNHSISLTPITVNTTFTGNGSKDYNVYISSNAKNYVSVAVKNRPQPASAGTAVLAHAGFASRSQIIGVYKNGDTAKDFVAGETIKVIKQGLIKNTELVAGKKYYLTDQGNIELSPNPLYDTLLVVGTTNNNGDLIVDCHNSVNAHAGVKPVGYIKELLTNEPEYGYLAMTGTYSKASYRALGNFLERCGESNPNDTSFTLNKSGYQIKYLDEGFEDSSVPRVPYLKFTGTFEDINSDTILGLNPQVDECALAVASKGYDISSLAFWSPMGIDSTDTDIQLSSFDIHLSVELEDEENRVVEIYPGFHQYNSNVYGFNWKLLFENNRYILAIDTGDTGNFGIAYIADPKRAPTKLNGKKYEIYVSRRDNGYTSLDIVNSILQLTRQDFDPNSTLPISGKALSKAGISSRLAAKKVLGTAREVNTAEYGDLASNFTLEENYTKLLQDDDTIASKALYEINSIIYKYIDDHTDAKPFIGVLIDQLRKIVENNAFDADHSHIPVNKSGDTSEGIDHLETYDLTSAQKEDIKKILNLLTNDKESTQVISSSIGLLIKAASETQKRLLNIESALFGRDYKTLPDHDTQIALENVYPKDDVISDLPARIGITRVVNALSKETLGSANPTGDAANPDNSSNNNRIKDLYKQIEGTNGDYGETGIELNLLTGENNSFVNNGTGTEAGQHGTGAKEESAFEVSKGTLNTYPSIEYGPDAGTQLTEPEEFEYYNQNPQKPIDSRYRYGSPLKGINDALNRIMYKLNILTSEIHGYDDILSRPARLSNIRTRLNEAISETYVIKTEPVTDINTMSINQSKNIHNSGLTPDNENYDPNFSPDITTDVMSLKDMYLADLYTKWDIHSSVDKSTSSGFTSGSDSSTIYRSSIINLIKETIGDPKALSPKQITEASESTSAIFKAPRNLISHSERLYNLENAIDTIITALFNRVEGDSDLKISDNYDNIGVIISSPDDTTNKADITRVQQEWSTNDGFKTLNNLIYGGDTPNSENNVIQTIIRELTGANTEVNNSNSFTTSTPITFIDIFKKFLEVNHYNNPNNAANDLNNRLIAADHIFDLTANGISYNNSSVLSQNDLKNRNIFYAKASGNITGSTDSFVKAYKFKAGIVYQFYKTGTKFGLVNDYTEITLAAGESITIHGQNAEAYATITADGNGNLDITADQVKTLVIPTGNTEVTSGALYIKEE